MISPRAGDRISNYLLDERIAAGSFGEVWKAHHHVFNEPVAIKIPTEAAYVRQLQREGLAIHGLRHPNIVRAIDLDPYATPAYLIMEYVDGSSLRQLIDAHDRGLSTEAVVAILSGTLAALAEAHKAGVIHRDIKPANILIAGPDLADLTPARVKVTDFGLGQLSQTTAASMMQSGSIASPAGQRLAGTLVYMSPEQRDGDAIDARSDLYSVGVVLHEMLTGVLPQGTDLPGAIRPDVPPWLDEMFARSYTRRDHRFESAHQMQQLIEHHMNAPADASRKTPPALPRIRPVGPRWECVSCHGPVSSSDQFCIHCGRQLAEHVRRCPTCNAFVGAQDNFCILCGIDLRKKA